MCSLSISQCSAGTSQNRNRFSNWSCTNSKIKYSALSVNRDVAGKELFKSLVIIAIRIILVIQKVTTYIRDCNNKNKLRGKKIVEIQISKVSAHF